MADRRARSRSPAEGRGAVRASEEFVKQANFSDPSVYDEAERDFEGWWESWAKELDWFEPWQTVLDWRPAVGEVVQGGQAQRLAQLPRPPRRRRARATRSPTTGSARTATTPDVTYAELLDDDQALRERAEGRSASARATWSGIFMPMMPETPAAMLACARIGATHNVVFGGFSVEAVKERMEVSDAKLLVTANATLRRGKPIADEGSRSTRCSASCRSSSTSSWSSAPTTDTPMQEGRDVWWHEACEKADAECEAEPLDAEHPLFILYTSGSTAKPKGILHTTGGYLTGVPPPTSWSSTSSPTRTSTGARPTSAGSRATPTSSTGRSRTARRR